MILESNHGYPHDTPQILAIGAALTKWRGPDRTYPVLALGFNHRAESFYRCVSDCPTNQNVVDTLNRGLKKVRVLHWNTPDCVQQKVVTLLNQFHEGSSESHYDIMQEAHGFSIR